MYIERWYSAGQFAVQACQMHIFRQSFWFERSYSRLLQPSERATLHTCNPTKTWNTSRECRHTLGTNLLQQREQTYARDKPTLASQLASRALLVASYQQERNFGGADIVSSTTFRQGRTAIMNDLYLIFLHLYHEWEFRNALRNLRGVRVAKPHSHKPHARRILRVPCKLFLASF